MRDAVGFDEKRGDSVNVVSASFVDDATEVAEVEPVPLWQQPMVRDIARLLFGAMVAIVLLLVVVRPLMRSLMAPGRAPASTPGMPGAAMADANGQIEPPVAAGAPALGAPRPAQPLDYESQVAAARTLLTQDPKRVAQVVKNWVGTDE